MAAAGILESHIISKRMPGLRVLLIPAGVMAIVWGAILLILFPLPQGLGVIPFLITVLSGLLRGLASWLVLHILRTKEVSRVIPVVDTNPVFVAILAVLLLGETLGNLQWAAIMVVVLGAVLISSKLVSSKLVSRDSGAGFARALVLPLIASLLLATANITSKYALEHVSYWNMMTVGALIMGGLALIVSLRPIYLRQLRTINRPILTAGLLFLLNSLAIVSMVLMFWAIQRGPVSLVSAIIGVRPAFVFVYAVILGRTSSVLLEQRMGWQTMVLRFGAIAMMVGGLMMIHLL